jgi:hypothetical protein
VDAGLNYGVLAVMGGPQAGAAQVANASIKVIAIAACIAAYEAGGSPVAPSIPSWGTLQDSTNLTSPENLLVIPTSAGLFGFVSNIFSTGGSGSVDYAAVNLGPIFASTPGTPTVAGTVSNASLAGAVYAVALGATIYATSRGGESLTQIDITTPGTPAIKGTPLSLGYQLTGIAVASYPDLGKIFAFVAGTETSGGMIAGMFFSVDVTSASAMEVVDSISNTTDYPAPSNVVLVGTIAYSTAYGPAFFPGTTSGITLTDVSWPYALSTISFTPTTTALGLPSGTALDHLCIAGSRGYQTDTSATGGVYVLQLGGAA